MRWAVVLLVLTLGACAKIPPEGSLERIHYDAAQERVDLCRRLCFEKYPPADQAVLARMGVSVSPDCGCAERYGYRRKR